MEKTMSEEAREARRIYSREYYHKNKESLLEYKAKWRKANPDKVRQYNINHFEKMAKELREAERSTD